MKGASNAFEGMMRRVWLPRVDRFRHPVELNEPGSMQDYVALFAECLTPVLLFISRGKDTRSRGMRSWVVLYVVRLDLLNGESIRQRAKSDGVSPARIQSLVNEFREMTPGFRSPQQAASATVAKVSAAKRKYHQRRKGLNETTFAPCKK